MSETVPFEGVEKRLVIQFADGHVHYDRDLRLGEGDCMKSPLVVSESEWQSVLDYASCEIVSSKELRAEYATEVDGLTPDDVKVYLLSESTLTVWKSGFLMKTCGRTTPFLAMQRLLDLYRCKSMKDLHVSWMTYSRLDFLYPEYQPAPHRNFPEEIDYAWKYFFSGQDDGASDASTSADSSSTPQHCSKMVSMPYYQTASITAGEHTLHVIFAVPDEESTAPGYHMEEVLMTKVAGDCVRRLTNADNQSERQNLSDEHHGQSLLRQTLSKSPKSVIDEFWFDPCGYSANVLFKNKVTQSVDYFSTHISPEEASSYASLEVGTWGDTSSFQRDDEFSVKPLIPAFAAKHQNNTRIHVTPKMDTSTIEFPEQETENSITFQSARFICQVSHHSR